NRRILGDAERAAEVEIPFGRYLSRLQWNIERSRHRLERDAGARNESFQKHVAGAKLETGSSGRRMKARDGKRTTSIDFARDAAVIERSLGPQRDVGRLRIALVALLDRRLHRAQFTCIHVFLPCVPGRRTYRLDIAKHKGGYHHMAAPAPGCSTAAFSGTRSPTSERSRALSTRALT